jgi:LmbE family N-acetylglucosaminyl deacetylase
MAGALGPGVSRSRAPVLMVVHAHPDDESSSTGGTLARYAAEGYRTVLVTCTDGRHGDPAGLDPGLVPARRSAELDLAAKALGIDDVVKLGYPDSGLSEDGTAAAADSFSRRPMKPLVQQLVRLIRMFAPDVLVTYPPNGLSAHPDHIRTHDVVVAAHAHIIGNDDGLAPKLYYIAISATSLQSMAAACRTVFGDDAWVPPPEIAVDDAVITARVDVTPFWEHKLAALKAHASQPDAQALLMLFSSIDVTAAHTEDYVRAYPPVDGRVDVERSLFDR